MLDFPLHNNSDIFDEIFSNDESIVNAIERPRRLQVFRNFQTTSVFFVLNNILPQSFRTLLFPIF